MASPAIPLLVNAMRATLFQTPPQVLDHKKTWSQIYEDGRKDYTDNHDIRHWLALIIRVLLAVPVLVICLIPCVMIKLCHRKQNLTERLIDINLRVAISVVYVPFAKLTLMGSHFATEPTPMVKVTLEEAEKIHSRLGRERVKLTKMLLNMDHRRRHALRAISNKGQEAYGVDTLPMNTEISQYHEVTRIFAQIKSQLADVETKYGEENMEEFARLLDYLKGSGYWGTSQWAKATEEGYRNFFTAISSISFVGAGLTYSSVFSAARGNVGLMCWSFCLFIIALAIILTIQTILLWCAQLRPRSPRIAPETWEMIIRICVFGAAATTVSSVLILILTVYLLQWDHPNAVLNSIVSRESRGDAALSYNVEPRPSAIFAFATIGLGLLLMVLLFAFYGIENGITGGDLLWRKHANDNNRKKWNDFYLLILTPEEEEEGEQEREQEWQQLQGKKMRELEQLLELMQRLLQRG